MQDLERVLDFNTVSERRIEQFDFFNWFWNVKNLVLSNGFKHVKS